jgi:hypothetical protein
VLKPTGGWGYHSDTEILFPMRVAPQLAELKGPEWRELVQRAVQSPEASPEQLAFSLLLIRLNGCLTCHTDCYRAMRGCTVCAITSIRRHRGSDSELAEMYEQALVDVRQHLNERHPSSELEVSRE